MSECPFSARLHSTERSKVICSRTHSLHWFWSATLNSRLRPNLLVGTGLTDDFGDLVKVDFASLAASLSNGEH